MSNKFRDSVFHEHVIEDEEGKIIGRLRVKPSGILWKPKYSHYFYRVWLEDFEKLAIEKDDKLEQ